MLHKIKPVLIAIMFFLTGCALNPLDRGEGHLLALPPAQVKAGTTHNGLLVIDYPTAPSILDSYRVALYRPTGGVDYYARTRWVDFLPVIIQTAVTETLSSSNIYDFVQSDENGLGSGYILHSRIEHFEAVYPADKSHPPEIRIEISFRLENVKNGTILKSFTLETRERASADTGAAIHNAFKSGFVDIQTRLVEKLTR